MDKKRYYIIGDIHGYYIKLKRLFDIISGEIRENDIIIFLGDYIDRGPDSFEVIDYLLKISVMYNAVFLTGNHEDMFLDFYTRGENYFNYIRNGGGTTIKSYISHMNRLVLPEKHKDFFNSLKIYYEGDDFIAVHAGLNPEVEKLSEQKRDDLIWVREEFYRSSRRWEKTIIFGHTPTPYLHNSYDVYIDDKRNIIGLDTFAMNEEYPLTCMVWPDRRFFQGKL
jgi:serine/threonine protein phosphatase 1